MDEKKSKKCAILLKLNFQKAYDTVIWGFIDNVLEANGVWFKVEEMDIWLYFVTPKSRVIGIVILCHVGPRGSSIFEPYASLEGYMISMFSWDQKSR